MNGELGREGEDTDREDAWRSDAGTDREDTWRSDAGTDREDAWGCKKEKMEKARERSCDGAVMVQ